MSTALTPEKVKHESAVPPPSTVSAQAEPVAGPASDGPDATLERGRFREWLCLLVWVGGALVLILQHLSDLLRTLFGIGG